MSVNKLPQHLAIIVDGNRRFAKRLMLEPWKGHEYGRDKLEKLIEWCIDAGIKELTLYTFSLQNFHRPKKEFDYLMNIFRDGFLKFYNDKRIDKYKIIIKVIGRYDMFPKDVVDSIKKIMEKTKNNNGFKLNFAMAYGSREELVDAVKKIVNKISKGLLKISDINESLIAKNLYLNSDPDLIIRTGGEKRTSNFLAWQSIYAEWIFLDKTWPEFDKKDFDNALDEYARRDRRFGK